MDLRGRFEPADYAFRFDWRTYLCTFFDEMRSMNMTHEAAWQVGTEFESLGYLSSFLDEDIVAVRRKRRVRIGVKSGDVAEEGGEELDGYTRRLC
jgi:hypothetical protein